MPINEENAARCLQLLQECRAAATQNNQLQVEVLRTFNVLTTYINSLLPPDDAAAKHTGSFSRRGAGGRDKEELCVITFQDLPNSLLEFGVNLVPFGNGNRASSFGTSPSKIPPTVKRSVGHIKILAIGVNGYAHRDGRLKIGDELIEINGYLMDRCTVERAR